MTRAEVLAAVLAEHLDGPCDDPRCHIMGRRNVRPLSEHIAEEMDAALAAQEGDANVCTCASGRGVRDCPQHAQEGDQGERPPTEPTAERRTPRLDALTRHVRDRKAEPTTEPTCAATYSSPHEDEVVYVCGEPATREWLDLTGRWSPVCDAHSAGRGVPADRLRPLPTAEPTWRAPNIVARELVDAWEESTAEGMSIGALREAISSACDLGGAYGQNIHESKAVLLRLGEQAVPLTQVSVGFHSGTGSFVMYLTAAQPTAERAGDADESLARALLTLAEVESCVAKIERYLETNGRYLDLDARVPMERQTEAMRAALDKWKAER